MADITWSDVESFYPALSAVASDAQDDIIAWVNGALAVSNFSGEGSQKLRMARIFMAAGQGELALPGAGNGQVASKTVSADSISVTYATSVTSAAFANTVGGAQFNALMRTTPARLGFVTGVP